MLSLLLLVCLPIAHAGSAQSDVLEKTCGLIYQGDFEAAAELIKTTHTEDTNAAPSVLKTVDEIITQYSSIRQNQHQQKKAAYTEQLAELEKSRVAADTNDINDVNDVNEITKTLSVIAKACEFAEESQKTELLKSPFVTQTFERAKTRAAEFEAQGKWLEAYTSCYWWLSEQVDKDNKSYSDYAEHLLEKADIAAAFQDTPCSSSEERFTGINKAMFLRAVSLLNSSYVRVIDYTEMASKSLRRCRLLAEVINSSPEVRAALDSRHRQPHDPQYNEKLTSLWSAELSVVLNEINQSPIGISKDKFIDIFEKTLTLNRETLNLPEQVLIAQFTQAALSSLDRYTIMVWPGRRKRFEKEMSNEFTGIGILISREKGLLTVASLLPDTPAYRSGLDAMDVIEAVDGVPTKDMTLSCAIKSITGPAGTEVILTVRSPGDSTTHDISIIRARIIVPTIRGWKRTETGQWLHMVDDAEKIGYVRLTEFSENTADDLEKVLLQLEAKGLKGLILDLRSNTGGLLNSAFDVSDKFLDRGMIVRTQPRRGLWTYLPAHKKQTHPNYPLVILIDSLSASASEIVAGTLSDPIHKRAVLVGERTYGKGSVQSITSYPGSGARLKYTSAHYYLPSGRVKSRGEVKKLNLTNWGVAPDVAVNLTSDELKKLRDLQRDNDILVKANHNQDSAAAPLNKHTIEEVLSADPQLAVGILILKTKLIEHTSVSRQPKLINCKNLN